MSNVNIKMSEFFTYDYETMMSLNHPDLSNIDMNLKTFFSSLPPYQITKEIRFHYPNKFNVYFNRRRSRPQTILSNDPLVLKSLRSSLSKISPQNFESITEQIIGILGDSEYNWEEVSELFYTNIIDGIFMVDVWVKLLGQLEKKYPSLVRYLHHQVIKQSIEPRNFQDHFTETAEDKYKRWQINNAFLIIQLYTAKKYSQNFLIAAIAHWIDLINPENLVPLEILVKILPKLKGKRIPYSEQSLKKLIDISQDKTYSSRLRLLLEIPTNT